MTPILMLGINCYCGQRIHGGQSTKKNEYPWMVRVSTFFVRDNKVTPTRECGGSLINSRWVLTGGACSYNDAVVTLRYYENTGPDEPAEETEVQIEISESIRYTGTDPVPWGSLRFYYNVALLKLKSDIDFMKHPNIRPVCLPEVMTEDYVGRKATMTDWGITKYSPRTHPTQSPYTLPKITINRIVRGSTTLRYSHPEKLQNISGVVQSNLECSKLMGCQGNPKEQCAVSGIPDNMLCVKYHEGKTCDGDYGGPLVTRSGMNYEQIGVAAFKDRWVHWWGHGIRKYRHVESQH